MVFQSVAQIVLSRLLDKFFYGINKNNMQVQLLDGRFVLSNIGLQPELLSSVNLPIQLKHSYVQQVEINIPWREEKVCLNVKISNIYVLLCAAQTIDIDTIYQVFVKKKQSVVEKALKQVKNGLFKQDKDKKELGTIQKMLLDLLNNVNITIQCIHLRFENKSKAYSFGVKLNEVRARTVDANDQPTFFDPQTTKEEYVRYTLKLDFLGVYLNSRQDLFLSGKSRAEVTNQFNRISKTRFLAQNQGSEDMQDRFNYILTINLKTTLKKYVNALKEGKQKSEKKEDKYLFQCFINLNRIQSRITEQQYGDILHLINFISNYQREYKQFETKWHLDTVCEYGARQLGQLLRKKKTVQVGEKEKLTLKSTCRRYMGWIFRRSYEAFMKRAFIKEAIKKQVKLSNLKENPKTFKIMTHINNQKLKLWTLIAIYYRTKFEDKVSVFFRNSQDKHRSFCAKYIDSVNVFQPLQGQKIITLDRGTDPQSSQVFLKLAVAVKQFSCQISRQDSIGVAIHLQRLRTELIVRQKSYCLKATMQDLQAMVFSCRKNNKLKTYVPIIRRNIVLDKSLDLLQISYEYNPLDKPFVYSVIDASFESVQITIYPQVFKQFYQILLGDKQEEEKPTKRKRKGPKKERNDLTERKDGQLRQGGFQYSIIRAKIRSPWVVLPLAAINDPSKQCWVVRLGDLLVDTPQHQTFRARREEQVFYEFYRMRLQNFGLDYFSSVNFFHNWQKFNYDIESLYKIGVYSKEKIITMIRPFSCYVDISVLKSALSPAIQQRKPKIIGCFKIDQVQIIISRFLLSKLKDRLQPLSSAGQVIQQFVETNVSSIREQHDLSGSCKVSWNLLTKMPFFCYLKGSFMYFFLNETHHRYHFFINLTEVAIRLISNQVENINTEHEKMVVFYLTSKQQHQIWRQKIMQILTRKERRQQSTSLGFFARSSGSALRLSNQQKRTSKQRGTLAEQSMSNENQRDTQRETEKQSQKVYESEAPSSFKASLSFEMQSLQVLLEQQDKKFIDCKFNQAKLSYQSVMTKRLSFSLQEWTVREGQEMNLLMSSKSFFSEESNIEESQGSNFLDIQCHYNAITGQLSTIDIKVDQIFLAWRVELFTRILLFFFYVQEQADAPAPINYNKSQLQILINFKRLNMYCYFQEKLLALGKLQFFTINYHQNKHQQVYNVICKIFQMDKYVGDRREPIILRKSYQGNAYNCFKLDYIFRKTETEAKGFESIQRLKSRFGNNLLASIITFDWDNTIIYFQMELTFRLLNYILSKILGTIASKFKKKEYSENYIYEALKICKLSIFHIKLNNFTFRMPPHERGQRQFVMDLQKLQVTKNLDEQYFPKRIQVKTIRHAINFFWESMVFKLLKVRLNYQMGSQKPQHVNRDPFDILFIYSKLNFQKEYFGILRHHDDINRRANIQFIIESPLVVDAHKIMFVTFLQLFYQNIKHKDGLAEVFEPPLPFPSLKTYNIYIGKIGLGMYEYREGSGMVAYSHSSMDKFKLTYEQEGSKSTITLSGQSLSSTGQLPIYSIDQKRSKFQVKVQSRQGQMQVILGAQYYALQVNLDNLNNILEFINYDNDYVSNKIMPKKKSSWQYITVLAKECQLRLGMLRATGNFYVTYLKGMANQIDADAQAYLTADQGFPNGQIDWSVLTDKQIKVTGENVKAMMGGDQIGTVRGFCFNRLDITSKTTNRRWKKERVQLSEGFLFIQLVDLLNLWNVYNGNIRKNSKFVLKQLFEPWDRLPPKVKAVQKRHTQVEIGNLLVNLLPTSQSGPLQLLRIDLSFPSIHYRTYQDWQEVQVNIRFQIHHSKNIVSQSMVADCRALKIRYVYFKDKKQKHIDILSARDVTLHAGNLNSKVIALLLKQAKIIKENQRIHVKKDQTLDQDLSYSVQLRNETKASVKLRTSNQLVFSAPPNQYSTLQTTLESVLHFFNNPKSYIQVAIENDQSIRKNANELSLNRPIPIQNYLLNLVFTPRQAIFQLRSPFTLKNMSSASIASLKGQHKVILKDQSTLVIPFQNNIIQFQIRLNSWSERCQIDTRRSFHLVGAQSFVLEIVKQNDQILLTLKDRFTIKHTLPLSIKVNDKQLPASKQLQLGYISQKQRKSYPIRIQQGTIEIDLTQKKGSCNFIAYLTQATPKQRNDTSALKCKIYYESTQVSKEVFCLLLYSELAVVNQSFKPAVFKFQNTKYILSAQQAKILPYKPSKLVFLGQNQQQTAVQLSSKTKIFYSAFSKLQVQDRANNKAVIVKIGPRFIFMNQSRQSIEVESGRSELLNVSAEEILQLNSLTVIEGCVTLIFGKYHRKQIMLDKKGINYLQMQQLFFKISVVGWGQSVLINLEDAQGGHQIVNNLKDIAITVRNPTKADGFEPQDNADRLVRPDSSIQVGLFDWNCPVLQLQFYYQAKNIQFQQKFQFSFSDNDHRYARKHVLNYHKNTKYMFVVYVIVEKKAEGRFVLTINREKDFEAQPIEKLKVGLQEASVSIYFSDKSSQAITLECYQAKMTRQKGAEMSDFDIQVDKLLVREGKQIAMINALQNGRFLNCQLIIAKSVRGTVVKNFIGKLVSLEVIINQKPIFRVLQKIAEVRRQLSGKKVIIEPRQQMMSRLPSRRESSGMAQARTKLDKEWKDQGAKLLKGGSLLVMDSFQMSATTLFLSYKKEEYGEFDQLITSDKIIKYLLLVPPISQLKLAIPHMRTEQFSGETKKFISQLVGKLKKNIGATIANSLSSLPLFDSPIIAADGIFKYIEGMLSIQ